MNTVDLIRHANLLLAIKACGSQAELARRSNIPAAYINQMVKRSPNSKSGKPRNVGDESARAIERALRKPIGWMDTPAPDSRLVYGPTGSDTDQISATVLVSNAAASMGPGISQEDESIIDSVRIGRNWLASHVPQISSPANLGILTAYGDSMAPTFGDGDLVLVDRGVTVIQYDAVYVLRRDDQLFLKRVKRRLRDGALIVHSDNPIAGPDDIIADPVREGLEIMGRVVYAWRGARL